LKSKTSLLFSNLSSRLFSFFFYCSPPPKWSPLYKKVVALARTCEAHGRFTQARQLFEAAGAWNELLALCVFQGDFNAVQSYARQAGKEVEGLADQLLAVNENTFMRLSNHSAFGGRPNVEDWTVQVGQTVYKGENDDGINSGGNDNVGVGVGLDFAKLHLKDTETDANIENNNNSDPSLMDFMDVEWEVAPAGRLPSMEASLRITSAAAASGVLPPERQVVVKTGKGGKKDEEVEEEEEGQPIAALDMHSLDAYLGVAGASVLKDATTGGVSGGGGGGGGGAAAAMLLDRADTSTSTELGAAAAQLAGTPRLGGAGDSASMPDSEADAAATAAAAAARGETVAQSAARAAFKRDANEDEEDDFFSSDEDDTAHHQPGGDTRSQASFAASASSNRLLINIRSPNETPRSDSSNLRAAALSLKLGGGSGSLQPPPSSTAAGAVPPSTGRSSYDDDDRSSMSSMEMMFNVGGGGGPSRTVTTHSIPTPPPAAPLAPAETPSPMLDDPFAGFADFNGTASTGSVGVGEPTTTSAGVDEKAKQPALVSKDPFAGLPGLPPTLAQAAATSAATTTAPGEGLADPFAVGSSSLSGPAAGASVPLAASAFSEEIATTPSSGAPMRAQPAAPVAQSDLLAGWDEFEALFGGGGASGDALGGTAAAAAAAAANITATTTTTTTTSQQDTSLLPVEEQTTEAGEASVSQSVGAITSAAAVPPPSNVKKAYAAGLTAFRKGKWSQASEQLSKALNGASGHKDPTTAAVFRQQCAYLYAAATLIVRSAAAPPAAASRLSRFAAALPLGEEQRAVTTAFAVEANMAAGNHAWAGDQLTWLVVVASEGVIGGPGLDPGTLAERLAACDRAENSNAALPAEEDVESFAAIVGSCEEKKEIDELLANLVQG
jgi:hypothetical protein